MHHQPCLLCLAQISEPTYIFINFPVPKWFWALILYINSISWRCFQKENWALIPELYISWSHIVLHIVPSFQSSLSGQSTRRPSHAVPTVTDEFVVVVVRQGACRAEGTTKTTRFQRVQTTLEVVAAEGYCMGMAGTTLQPTSTTNSFSGRSSSLESSTCWPSTNS
jgi:hypothetical protein